MAAYDLIYPFTGYAERERAGAAPLPGVSVSSKVELH